MKPKHEPEVAIAKLYAEALEVAKVARGNQLKQIIGGVLK